MKKAPPDVDAASLSRLHDIIELPHVGWWPPAPGWYVVGVLLLVLLLWSLWRWAAWWRRNAYRREAIKLLKALPVDASGLPQLDELLKRVALAAYPRDQVASLSGVAWLEFLDQTTSSKEFIQGTGRVLGEAAYTSEKSQVNMHAVMTVAENWIRQHERPHSC